jgi:hypothetical protein
MAYASTPWTHSAESRPLLPVLIALASLLFVFLLLQGPVLAIVAVGGAAAALFALVRPRFAVHAIMVASVFSGIHIEDRDIALGGRLFKSLGGAGLPITPVEVILFAAAVGMLIRLMFDDEIEFRPGALALPVVVFMIPIAFALAHGLSGGANMSVLRSETRGLTYLPLLYFLTTHFIRTRRDLNQLMTTMIIAVQLLAIMSIHRYAVDIRGSYNLSLSYDLAFAHESAVFCAAAIIALLARVVWSDNPLGEWRNVALIVLPMAAILIMRRRTGMVALDASLLLLCIVLLRMNLRMFLTIVPLAVLGLGLLVALTWNEPGGIGQPARAVRTITGDGTTSRDQASDSYRDLELLNVWINIKSNNPVTGLGFGQTYPFYIQVADLSFWPLWHYVPHNTFYWVWLKAGPIAFMAMLALLGSAMWRAAQVMTTAPTNDMRAAAFALSSIVVMFAIFAYADLGWVTLPAVTFFAIALGAIGALSYTAATPAPGAADAEGAS